MSSLCVGDCPLLSRLLTKQLIKKEKVLFILLNVTEGVIKLSLYCHVFILIVF